MKRKVLLSDEELALWAHVAQSVKPMPGRRMPHFEMPASVKIAPADHSPVSSSLRPTPERPSLKPMATMERRMRQRVSRGQLPIHGIIDLHGMRQEEAHRMLLSFIQRKQHEGASVVMVITGKGGSASRDDGFGEAGHGRGVLKRMVPHWLADPGMRRCVIGYEDAAQHHGGTGALYVRLRRIRDL